LVDLDGKIEPLMPDGLPFKSLNDPRISRSGRQLLLSVEGGAVYMVDLDTQTPTLMSESGFYPLWSPDGSEIVYASSRGESFDIYRRPVDLSRPEELYLDITNNLRAGDWSRQGAFVIREEIPGKGMDLRTIADIDDPTMVPLLEGDDDELAPVVSADGKWLAYVSNYSGTDEIYVTSFPEPGARLQVSIKGGTSPTWAPDGSAIYYFEGIKLIAVSIETEPRFRVTGREVLFEGDYVQYRWSRQYDIHPDGKRFILIKNPTRGNIEVVTNWFDELRKLTY
jgi:Tol biopolymer transport system component